VTTRRSLRELAIEYGTDKQGRHAYADHYERHLGHLRDSPIVLLEIGVGGYTDPSSGGESLRMWKAFFPRARVIGVDVHDKQALAEDRIEIVQGDQGDATFLERLGRTRGPFDVVIDDGSHVNAHVVGSFLGLFPHLTAGAIYAIEDLQTSYWERGYGGSSRGDRAATSMSFLKGLVDGLNYAELDVADYEPSATDLRIAAISFYHNLAFIMLGPNDEPSNVLPPHPRPAALLTVEPETASGRSRPARKPGPARRLARAVIPAPARRRVRALFRTRRAP
jgi:hypothetical protein